MPPSPSPATLLENWCRILRTAGNISSAVTGTPVFSPVQVNDQYCRNGHHSTLHLMSGTLIFDPVLKICNWPDSTTCISDLLGPPSNRRVKLPGFVAATKAGDSRPPRPTEAPVIVRSEKTTPANKLSKRILSLFQTKNRRPSRFRSGGGSERNNNSDNKSNSSRRRVSSFKSKKDRNTFRNTSQATTSTTTSTTTTSPSTTTGSRATNSVTERVPPRIRPFKLSATTRTPFRSRLRLKNPVKPVAEKEEEDEDDLEVSVRKESSVTSITSSVRVSVREESSLAEDERPFSNGRGGEQFSVSGEEEEGEGDYLSRIREKVELESGTSSTTARPRAKPIKCHTGIVFSVEC